jgi:hypothetical protein
MTHVFLGFALLLVGVVLLDILARGVPVSLGCHLAVLNDLFEPRGTRVLGVWV